MSLNRQQQITLTRMALKMTFGKDPDFRALDTICNEAGEEQSINMVVASTAYKERIQSDLQSILEDLTEMAAPVEVVVDPNRQKEDL
jgi:hypothetical protein